jgi:hypothetical protein
MPQNRRWLAIWGLINLGLRDENHADRIQFFGPHHRGFVMLTMNRSTPMIKGLYRNIFVTIPAPRR